MIMRLGLTVEVVALITLDLQCLTMLNQKCKIAVHGSKAYVRIYALNMCIYFLGGRVGGRVAEIIQYSFALPAVI